jgi:hypothetical protein
LEKYWLPSAEYDSKYKLIQDRIFVSQVWLPRFIFHEGYEILAFRGGCLFGEENFLKTQKCFKSVGDKHFFVIENTFEGRREAEEPVFRMKYPADITWDELTSGNFISAIIFDFLNKEFFVFGEGAAWGKHSSSSTTWPVNLVGFLPDYASLFRRVLSVPEAERSEILTWLPDTYRKSIK